VGRKPYERKCASRHLRKVTICYPKLEYSRACFFKDTDTKLDRYGESIFEIAGQWHIPLPGLRGLPVNIADPAHGLGIAYFSEILLSGRKIQMPQQHF
jgi:hypothetical protein